MSESKKSNSELSKGNLSKQVSNCESNSEDPRLTYNEGVYSHAGLLEVRNKKYRGIYFDVHKKPKDPRLFRNSGIYSLLSNRTQPNVIFKRVKWASCDVAKSIITLNIENKTSKSELRTFVENWTPSQEFHSNSEEEVKILEDLKKESY